MLVTHFCHDEICHFGSLQLIANSSGVGDPRTMTTYRGINFTSTRLSGSTVSVPEYMVILDMHALIIIRWSDIQKLPPRCSAIGKTLARPDDISILFVQSSAKLFMRIRAFKLSLTVGNLVGSFTNSTIQGVSAKKPVMLYSVTESESNCCGCSSRHRITDEQ